jgi:hypothetical protein
MVRLLAFACLLLIAPLLVAADNHDPALFEPGPAVLRNRAVFDCFMHLLHEAKFGYVSYERAAFLVLQRDGVHCVDWPITNDFQKARWSGPKPAGVVAIAHTHPVAIPEPSSHDVEQARRNRMPMFVLTPMFVYLVYPSGRTELLAPYGEWMHFHDVR